jgi:hypothetical protein
MNTRTWSIGLDVGRDVEFGYRAVVVCDDLCISREGGALLQANQAW